MFEKPQQHLIGVDFEDGSLVGDVLSDGSTPALLVLHGAGDSCRQNFKWLREELWAAGISSAAFDFVGHGDTGGDLKSSSLSSRTRQACRVIDALRLKQPFALMGVSMSGYTAVKLLEHYRIKNLILVVPAMYTAQAYRIPFNGGFSGIIRQPQSWVHSDAWHILADYRGRLLVVAGEEDRIIPRSVVTRIYGAAVNASERELYVAPKASHFVFTDLRSKNPEEFEYIFRRICKTLRE
jgi:pimeloyl-ACP methyl ester carboxylesterase